MPDKKAKSLPVVMYHYVNESGSGTAVSRAVFEDHCRTLKANGWRGVSLAQAEAFLIDGEPLPAKSILLTFDDGYLDNYLYAMPILQKYGHCGVMFAVTNRLESDEEPRVSLDDALLGRGPELPGVLDPVDVDELGYRVRRDIFCNRGEVRAMERSGVMSVAAHSRGHYGVAAGPEYEGFVRPGEQLRTFYLTEQPFIWGMPEFKVKPGLERRAFIPSPELVKAVSGLVPQTYREADLFFHEKANVAHLKNLVDSFAGKMGRMENDEERRERLNRELVQGKLELEEILGHEIKTLCWPWGPHCEDALAIALNAGFELFFTTEEGTNPPGLPLAAHRFKGKNKSGKWLLSRARIYSRPLLGSIYAKLRT